mmetsp:Transcript_35733/g.66189  ORF Transcript_35733/g.66189 Transcript_35733/m.66189 type:complete len:102 (-) Transcript_35733:220-525(-)
MPLLPVDTARARIFTRRGGCCWSEGEVVEDCLAYNGPNGELLKRCCWTGRRWDGMRRELFPSMIIEHIIESSERCVIADIVGVGEETEMLYTKARSTRGFI